MFPVRWWWSTSELQLQYGNCNSAILQSILHVFHLVLLFFPVFYIKNFHQTSVKLTLAPSKGVRTYPLHCLSFFMVFMELPVVLSTLKPLKISSSWDILLAVAGLHFCCTPSTFGLRFRVLGRSSKAIVAPRNEIPSGECIEFVIISSSQHEKLSSIGQTSFLGWSRLCFKLRIRTSVADRSFGIKNRNQFKKCSSSNGWWDKNWPEANYPSKCQVSIEI